MPLSEDEQQVIRRGILAGQQRHAVLELEKRLLELQGASDREWSAANAAGWMRLLFLTKYTSIPGFYQHVISEVRGSKRYAGWRRVLLKAALVGIVTEGAFRLAELEDDLPDREAVETEAKPAPPTSRTIRTLARETFSDVIYETPKQPVLSDERHVPYTTTFSTELPAATSARSKALFSLGLEEQWPGWSTLMDTTLRYAPLRFTVTVQPVEMAEFRTTAFNILRGIEVRSDKERERVEFLRSEFAAKGGSIVPVGLYTCLSQIVAARWWAAKNHETQRRLLHDGFPPVVDEVVVRSAQRAVADLLGEEDAYAYLACEAAKIYEQEGRREWAAQLLTLALDGHKG